MKVNQPKRGLGRVLVCLLGGFVLVALAAAALHFNRAGAGPGGTAQSQPARHWALAAYQSLPLAFEANQGQTDLEVKYLARGGGYTLFLTSNGAVWSLSRTPASRGKMAANSVSGVVRMEMAGANPLARIAGHDLLPGVSNYFIGNDPAKWRTHVAQYGRVAYQDVYPGVNLAFHGEPRCLEFDFIVAAGADPGAIDLRFSGAKQVATDTDGDLVLASAAGDLRLRKPVAYQEENGARQLVNASFVLKGKRVRFKLGSYDHGRELVIDPSFTVSYATYLGGSLPDDAFGVAADGSGNAYVTGQTQSSDFPPNGSTTKLGPGGGFDAFVSKLSADGSTLMYSTIIGGTGDDSGTAIAVDASGNAYVAGGTKSSDFPFTPGVFQTGFGGGVVDAFVLKLNSSGSALIYSTFLGGSNDDVANGIALDTSSSTSTPNVCVVGVTKSTTDFPILNPIQPIPGGASNGFVTKINNNGTARIYSTYLGGSTGDLAAAVAVDSSGNAYVTGETFSSTFPHTTGAFQTACNSCSALPPIPDTYVTAINSTGSAYVYSTFLGGSQEDDGFGIAVDSAKNAYVTGETHSSTDFPTKAASQGAFGGGNQDAFVTALNPTGTALVYSTYLGGSQDESGTGIAVDSNKNAYVTGQTDSSNFPTMNPTQSTLGGANDAFVAEFSSSGSQVFSTYLGGSSPENTLNGSGPIGAVAVDNSGNIYLAGNTSSSDFPVAAAVQKTYGGGSTDAFVAKLTPGAAAFTISATALSPASVAKGGTATSTVTVQSLNGFSSAVSLSCSSQPSGISCGSSNFNPSTLTPPANGTSPASTFTVTAPAAASLGPSPLRRKALAYALWLPVGGIALIGAGLNSRKKKMAVILLGCLALSGLIFLPGCGSSSGNNNGGGTTFTITVTGSGTVLGKTVTSSAPALTLTVK